MPKQATVQSIEHARTKKDYPYRILNVANPHWQNPIPIPLYTKEPIQIGDIIYITKARRNRHSSKKFWEYGGKVDLNFPVP